MPRSGRILYQRGGRSAPQAPRDFEVIDPSTEETCAVISPDDQADTNAAVVAARAAFEGWMIALKALRSAMMEKLAALHEARKGETAEAIWRRRHRPRRAASI